MNRFFRLLYPEDEGGSGGTETGGDTGEETQTDTTPAPVTLDSKIKLADGTEVSVGDLVNSHQKVAELAPKVEELTTQMGTVGRMFSNNVDESGRIAAVTQTLQGLGYTQDQIDTYVDETFGSGDDDTDYDDDDDYEGDDDVPGNEALQGQVDQLQRAQHQQLVVMLKDRLDETLKFQVDNHPRLKVLFEKNEALARQKYVTDGVVDEAKVAEALTKARSSITQQLENQTLQRLNQVKARTGEFDPSMFLDQSATAANDVADVFQTALVDIDLVGRAPETVSGNGEFDMLAGSKPVPPPRFDEKDPSTYDVQTQVTDHAIDKLTRLAASSSTEGSKA